MQALSKTEMHSVAGGNLIDPWGNPYHGVIPDNSDVQPFPCICNDGEHYGTPGTAITGPA